MPASSSSSRAPCHIAQCVVKNKHESAAIFIQRRTSLFHLAAQHTSTITISMQHVQQHAQQSAHCRHSPHSAQQQCCPSESPLFLALELPPLVVVVGWLVMGVLKSTNCLVSNLFADLLPASEGRIAATLLVEADGEVFCKNCCEFSAEIVREPFRVNCSWENVS